jgi:Icc-related predicted phosphoesterase
MIRILYMSDLHLEMEQWRLPVPGWPAFLARHRAVAAHPARGPMLDGFAPVDLVVLAGDIHNGFRGVVYADQVAKYFGAPVVTVAGNHEFYHHATNVLLPALREASHKTGGRVTFLEDADATYTIRGRRLHVLGCTLWTDYALLGNPDAAMRHAGQRMNDHVFIEQDGAKFTPANALARHRGSVIWLRTTLAALRTSDPDCDVLIVTHHAPSGAVLGERTGPIAPAYGSDLLAAFAPFRPAGWIHGHTHFRHDSVSEGVRLVSAPRGYVAYEEAALRFRPGILEI